MKNFKPQFKTQWLVLSLLLGISIFGLAPAHVTVSQDTDADDAQVSRTGQNSSEHEIVSIGHNSVLKAGDHALSVVSIFGSSNSAGQVENAVVSVLGDSRATGPVGDSVVAVLGNTYVDSKVDQNVVAVFGNVELGPNADIGGDVVTIGGTLIRHPAAKIGGDIPTYTLPFRMGSPAWLNSWIKNCFMFGRPLALATDLGWAWTLALGLLAFYCLLALMFHSGVDRCVSTLQTQPGRVCLAGLLSVLILPLSILLLLITVIGIVLVPFVFLAVFIATIFGKVVILSWVGRRITGIRDGSNPLHAVAAVVVGGAVVLLLYLVPVVGFILYPLIAWLGLGVVLFTLIVVWRTRESLNRFTPTTPEAIAATAVPAGAMPVGAIPTDTIAPAPAAAPPSAPILAASLQRAGFWRRMAALLLDIILIGFVVNFVHDSNNFWLIALATYGAVMWKIRGTTVGGILLGLKIVRADGRPIDWPTAIVRALGCFLSLLVIGLGFIWIAFDPEGQAWHDKIAGTFVVKAPKGASLV